MENIPKQVFLQIGEDFDADDFTGDFSELSEVTWHKEKIYDNDLVYFSASFMIEYLKAHSLLELNNLVIESLLNK